MFWPAAARRLWPAVLFVATIALVALPVTTQSGEALEKRVGESAIVEAHAKEGEQALPFAIVLWLAVAGVSAWVQLTGRTSAAPRSRFAVSVVLAVLALIGGIGATAAVVISGHSGARAVWTK